MFYNYICWVGRSLLGTCALQLIFNWRYREFSKNVVYAPCSQESFNSSPFCSCWFCFKTIFYDSCLTCYIYLLHTTNLENQTIFFSYISYLLSLKKPFRKYNSGHSSWFPRFTILNVKLSFSLTFTYIVKLHIFLHW